MDFFIKFANILQSIMRVISLILITAFIACGCTGHTEYSPAPMTDSLSHHELASKMLYHQPLLECRAEQQKADDDAREHHSKKMQAMLFQCTAARRRHMRYSRRWDICNAVPETT